MTNVARHELRNRALWHNRRALARPLTRSYKERDPVTTHHTRCFVLLLHWINGRMDEFRRDNAILRPE